MRLGLMNNPARDPLKEIARAAELQFDFLDLTLEPPACRATELSAERIKNALADHNLGVVGHTAYYLPFGSAFDAVQAGAVTEAIHCLELFAQLGVDRMNLHLDCRVPGYGPDYINARNIAAIEKLLPVAEERKIRLMVENVEGDSAASLAPLFEAIPSLGLHLDIGHANIATAGRKSHTADLLSHYADRLCHVHLSDNKGKGDDHLAIGAGTIDWKRELRLLKASGYDDTITLEIFYGDGELIRYSANKVRELWRTV
ncbi:MAG: sugar phosphate isomerase/epimerase [Akkermansiaceae bacterium]|nr:sugar phosphate isomerase/epimerase [Armatimonadota bacterium]